MSRRRRPAPWAATEVPVMARSLAVTGAREAARLADLAVRARAIGRNDLAAQLDTSAATAALGARGVQGATLFWVTEAMARLAMDASQDVPAVDPDDDVADHALMVMAEPLPRWDTTLVGGLALRDGARTDVPYHEPVDVDAISWHMDRGRGSITIELMCRPHRLPLPLLGHQSPLLVPFTTLTATVPGRLDTATTLGPAGVSTAHASTGVLSWLQATWTLMTQPNLTSTSPAAPRPNRAPRPGRRDPSDVVVLDLRPTRRAIMTTGSDPQDTGRRLTTRHVVRGHWTRQPHGPGNRLRRLQWIDDYIRGPEGAPLVTRTHVWAWRR